MFKFLILSVFTIQLSIANTDKNQTLLYTSDLRSPLLECHDCFTWDGEKFFENKANLSTFLRKNCLDQNSSEGEIAVDVCETLIPITKANFNGDIISSKLASQLLRFLMYRTDITFEYFEDGCYARNVVMRDILNKIGINSQSIFIKADDGRRLVAETNFDQADWRWHVAPVIKTRNDEGQVEKVVIDPSISDKPISVSKWASIMGHEFCPQKLSESDFLSKDNSCGYYIDTKDTVYEIDLGWTGLFKREFVYLSREERVKKAIEFMSQKKVKSKVKKRMKAFPRYDSTSRNYILLD